MATLKVALAVAVLTLRGSTAFTPPASRVGPPARRVDRSSTRRAAVLGGAPAQTLAVASAAIAGKKLGETPVGSALSGPVCAMALTFAASQAGLLDASGAPCVRWLMLWAVKGATPLILETPIHQAC